MSILKEELKHVKEKQRKIENANNDLNDKLMEPLNKKEKEMLQEVSKIFWETQKALETVTESINYKERKKKEASGTRRLMRYRRKNMQFSIRRFRACCN